MSQVGVLHAGLSEATNDLGSFFVTASGTDKVGVMAKLAGALADLGVAIDNIDQEINANNFQITIEAHAATDDSTWADIQQAMDNLSRDLDIDAKAFYSTKASAE
ncbi:MAG: ACT domain-containing protein [Eggerthellaceae bacterium]